MMNTSSDKRYLVLGATGQVGSALFQRLRDKGVDVTGTCREETHASDRMRPLDITAPEELARFPWHQFDCIVNCVGSVLYDKSLSSMKENIAVNVSAPLSLLSHLDATQTYYHCSTHAVLLSSQYHTAYSFSKRMFEEIVLNVSIDKKPTVIFFRLPALFSDARTTGVFSSLKQRFREQQPIEMRWEGRAWHPMYLPRCADMMAELLLADVTEPVVTLGYPRPVSLPEILAVAEEHFGFVPPRQIEYLFEETYVPDLRALKKYVTVHADDFIADLKKFFAA